MSNILSYFLRKSLPAVRQERYQREIENPKLLMVHCFSQISQIAQMSNILSYYLRKSLPAVRKKRCQREIEKSHFLTCEF
jgi:hypothetical protein